MEGTELRKIAIDNGFYADNEKATFDDKRPSLKLPNISEEELIILRERFALYVKMPTSYYKYIKRSEVSDETGKKLIKELNSIYDKCVFQNNGMWNDSGNSAEHFNRLKKIYTDQKDKILSANLKQ